MIGRKRAEQLQIPDVLVNPCIVESMPEKEIEKEGCLSFPGISVKVERLERVKLKFEPGPNTVKSVWIAGFDARMIQHEIDHLDGKLFIDHLPHLRQEKIRTKMILKGGKHA